MSAGQVEEAPGADSTMIEAIVRIDDKLVVLLTLGAILSDDADLAVAAA